MVSNRVWQHRTRCPVSGCPSQQIFTTYVGRRWAVEWTQRYSWVFACILVAKSCKIRIWQSWVCWHTPVFLELGRWGQEGQELKAPLSYSDLSSSRSAWAPELLVQNTQKNICYTYICMYNENGNRSVNHRKQNEGYQAHLLKLELHREKISMALEQQWLADLQSVPYFFEIQIKYYLTEYFKPIMYFANRI